MIETLCLVCAVALTAAVFDRLGRHELSSAIAGAGGPLHVINLGNSHGCSFDYSMLTVDGGSFNKEGNTLYYDLQNYRFLKPRLAPGAVVIIPLSYFSFGLDENRSDRGENNGFDNEFYEYLPNGAIHNYSGSKRRRLAIHRIQQGMRSLFPGAGDRGYGPAPDDEETQRSLLARHAAERAGTHKRLADYRPPDGNIRHLEALVGDAVRSGFRPVLMATPFSREYNEAFDGDWLRAHYYGHIERLQRTWAVPFLDYSRDPRFSPHPLMFGDADHLSLPGKRIFNEIMWRDLVDIGCLRRGDLLARANGSGRRTTRTSD